MYISMETCFDSPQSGPQGISIASETNKQYVLAFPMCERVKCGAFYGALKVKQGVFSKEPSNCQRAFVLSMPKSSDRLHEPNGRSRCPIPQSFAVISMRSYSWRLFNWTDFCVVAPTVDVENVCAVAVGRFFVSETPKADGPESKGRDRFDLQKELIDSLEFQGVLKTRN